MAAVLTELVVGDEPAAWEAAGFALSDDHTWIGSVRVRLVGPGLGRGVLAWHLDGIDDDVDDIDGLPTAAGTVAPRPAAEPHHPNGITQLDHVVVVTSDLERTTRRLESLGIAARRSRDTGSTDRPRRQVFFWLGESILELVGPSDPTGTEPARFWGLAFVSPDLDATARHLGDRAGQVKDAVQPGRRITTIRHRDLDMSVPLAVMSPHVRPVDA